MVITAYNPRTEETERTGNFDSFEQARQEWSSIFQGYYRLYDASGEYIKAYFNKNDVLKKKKQCTHCQKTKLKTEKNFQRQKDSGDGFRSICRMCTNSRQAKYREKNKKD